MKALIHYNTFLFNSSQKKLGSSNIFVFFIIFYHVLDIFRLGKPKKITSICIPTDGNFPIFENSTLSSRRKSDLIFPCNFSRIRYTVTFCELWPYVIPFSLIRRITAHLVNLSKKIHQVFRPTNRPHH